jgi:hypothetical protein
MDSYQRFFENELVKISYDMLRLKSKTFLPIGLELNSINIFLDRNDTFKLKDVTFGFYNPIENSIHINIDDVFFKDAGNDEERSAKLFLVLFHEAMHKILMHTPERLNNRKPILWNIAADYEVHNMYYIYTNDNSLDDMDKAIMGKYMNYVNNLLINKQFPESPVTPRLLFEKDYLDKIAEEIYEMISNSEEISYESFDMNLDDLSANDGSGENESEQSASGSGAKVKVKKSTYKLPNGKKHSSYEIEWPENEQLPDDKKISEEEIEKRKQNQLTNKSLLENTFAQMGKQKGNMPAECQKFLKKLFHIKIDWVKILRNSLHTILDKSDYFAWSKVRTSAFLLPNMSYLPDIIEDNEKYGTLIIARDESGSMSDEDISKAGQIIMDAKAYYKKIIVIKHDTEISKIEEFEELTEDTIKTLFTRERYGGTSHKKVFEYLREYYKTHRYEDKISCFISITDMESDIHECQDIVPADIPIIYLAPMQYEKDFEGIKGQVIPIEL